jgi:hypothetical protein
MITLRGIISNAIRGGQWREWLGVKDSRLKWVKSDAINATIYAMTVYYVTGNPIIAALSFPCMWLGAAPGWGDYIGALGGWRKIGLEENRFIDPIISPLERFPRWWGFAGLTIRGAFWGLCLAVPFVLVPETAIKFIGYGAMMGLVYAFALMWAKHRAPESYQAVGWALGELLFPAALWSALI